MSYVDRRLLSGQTDMKPPAFPLYWDYRRVAEILVAGYATVLGFTFMVFPGTLDFPHYARLGGAEAAYPIGLMILLAAMLHSWALWLNGTNPIISRRARTVACLFHMAQSLFFAWQFALAGVYWGAICLALVCALIYLALHRAFDP